MELIRDLCSLLPGHKGCVATIGNFDGVHLGHQAILRKLRARSSELQVPSVVVVFEPLPGEYFAPNDAPARLMSFREKFVALRDQGIDRLLCVRFDEKLSKMTAQRFGDEIFVKSLGIKYLIFGDDFRFGNNREGDILFAKELGKSRGFEAEAVETFYFEGSRVSSTRIREALADSEFDLATSLLGRPYSIEGKVIYGRQLGRLLGVPTANIELARSSSPLSGVYVVEVSGKYFRNAPGVANIGTRPTVSDSIRANLEVHLLDFSGEIYGQNIDVTFLSKLREEEKFESIDELKTNMEEDLRTARLWFDSNLAIGKRT